MIVEEYLNKFDKFTKDPDLKAMEYIMDKFDSPYKKIKCVHVAGTNGKGSVCEMLNNVLMCAGYKVGKFISPHLIRFNDGICINNEEIEDKDVESILIQMSSVIDEYNAQSEVPVKWFEVITSLSYIYFERQKVDIAIIETGLGGTTDCTNIIEPLASIITNIGYDHMDILGDTIDKIAKHKAGIIKENSYAVAVHQNETVVEIIKQVCKEKNTNLHIVEESNISDYKLVGELQEFSYGRYNNILINLKGKCQTLNAAEVLAGIDILKTQGFDIEEEAIRKGLSTVIHRARLEVLNREPLMIFDGGHNESAITTLRENIETYYNQYDKKVYIISILNTKDYRTIVEHLCTDKNATFIFTNGINRTTYVNKKDLYNEAKKYIDEVNLHMDELENALSYSKEKYADSLILIVGSFYVYKKACEVLKND